MTKRKRNTITIQSTQVTEKSTHRITMEGQTGKKKEAEKQQSRRKRVTGRCPRMKRATIPEHTDTNIGSDEDDGQDAEEQQQESAEEQPQQTRRTQQEYFQTRMSPKLVHD